MTEIRICWSRAVGMTKLQSSDGGLWLPETARNLEDFKVIVDAGNRSYGEGAHWIDRRQA